MSKKATTNYELINQNLSIIAKLVNNGLVKIDMLKHLEIYEKFHSLTGNKTERYQELADQFGVHPLTIQRAIVRLNKKVK